VFSTLAQWCALLAREEGGCILTPGWDIIRGSGLREHPIFGHYLQVLDLVSRLLKSPCNFQFALPGDPIAREFLAGYFPPPLVLLDGGNWAIDSPFQRNLAALAAGEAFYFLGERLDASRFPGIKLDRVRSPRELAEAAIDSDRRFRKMQISYITTRTYPDQSSTDR
jgi:hypothetical protein